MTDYKCFYSFGFSFFHSFCIHNNSAGNSFKANNCRLNFFIIILVFFILNSAHQFTHPVVLITQPAASNSFESPVFLSAN